MRFSERPLTTRLITSLLSAILIATSSFISPTYALPEQTTLTTFEDQIRSLTGNYDISNEDIIEEVHQVTSVEPLISSIAEEMGVSSTTMYNVALSESGLQADPKGHNDGGLACGVVQVHADVWHMDCQDLIDHPEVGLRFLAKHLKMGDAWKYWTSLNCYTYLSHLVDVPKMAQIQVDTTIPHTGEVAIFWYRDKSTKELEKHVAYVSSVQNNTFTVKEANFKGGLIGERVIPKSDPYLSGFYDPRL